MLLAPMPLLKTIPTSQLRNLNLHSPIAFECCAKQTLLDLVLLPHDPIRAVTAQGLPLVLSINQATRRTSSPIKQDPVHRAHHPYNTLLRPIGDSRFRHESVWMRCSRLKVRATALRKGPEPQHCNKLEETGPQIVLSKQRRMVRCGLSPLLL